MPDVLEIPVNFAVLRRAVDNRRPSTFQILYAQSYNWGEYHMVENVGWVREDEVYPVIRQSDARIDANIYTLRLQRPGWPEVQSYKFWKLPLYFMRNGAQIPVFDFQYTSWIPNRYTPIPLAAEGRNELERFINDIKRLRCEQIALTQQPVVATPPRQQQQTVAPAAPPRRRRNSLDRMQQIEADHEFALNIQSLLDAANSVEEPAFPILLRPPTLEIPPPAGQDDFGDLPALIPMGSVWQPVSNPDPQILRQPLLLPKHIGDLILADARTGSQDCPIAAIPFSQCPQLSVTSCFHVFDRRSLGIWMEEHTSCPVCRTQIANVVHG